MPRVKPITTIEELELALSFYPPETPIVACWEGQEKGIWVAQDQDGTVILDVDDGWYAEELNGP